MCPKTKAQFAEIRESRKAQIIEAALEVFTQYGCEAASMNQVASRANISKGLIYNYFNSKHELLVTIVDKGVNDLMQYFDPNKDGFLSDEELILFIDTMFSILDENPRFWQLYFSLMGQPSAMKIFQEKFRILMEMTMQPLVEYYKRKGRENPEEEAMLLGAVLDGIGMHYILSSHDFPKENIKKLIIEKFT